MADLAVTAANVVIYTGASTGSGTAGEALTAGEPLYKHTDGKYYAALADTALHAACVGVALNDAAAEQPITFIKSGGFNPGAAVTVGYVYGITDTAGGISLISERAAADFPTILGFATTTSRIELDINKPGVVIA